MLLGSGAVAVCAGPHTRSEISVTPSCMYMYVRNALLTGDDVLCMYTEQTRAIIATIRNQYLTAMRHESHDA